MFSLSSSAKRQIIIVDKTDVERILAADRRWTRLAQKLVKKTEKKLRETILTMNCLIS